MTLLEEIKKYINERREYHNSVNYSSKDYDRGAKFEFLSLKTWVFCDLASYKDGFDRDDLLTVIDERIATLWSNRSLNNLEDHPKGRIEELRLFAQFVKSLGPTPFYNNERQITVYKG